MANSATILLVEDNPDDAALTEMALRGVLARTEIARDADEAFDYLFGDTREAPRLVLLDLRLPDTDGLEVLRRIREDERTRLIPVVVLTASMAPGDVAESYRLGANSYVCKPVDFEEFSARVHEVGSYWLRTNTPPSNAGESVT